MAEHKKFLDKKTEAVQPSQRRKRMSGHSRIPDRLEPSAKQEHVRLNVAQSREDSGPIAFNTEEKR